MAAVWSSEYWFNEFERDADGRELNKAFELSRYEFSIDGAVMLLRSGEPHWPTGVEGAGAPRDGQYPWPPSERFDSDGCQMWGRLNEAEPLMEPDGSMPLRFRKRGPAVKHPHGWGAG